jgi:hypothetical protein
MIEAQRSGCNEQRQLQARAAAQQAVRCGAACCLRTPGSGQRPVLQAAGGV